MVSGEWDVDVPVELTQALFLEIKNASNRRWVEIGEATYLVWLEKN